jgi:EAL domain-containing protein (putative c-di-GMP-specific phosphodiesterase class I)
MNRIRVEAVICWNILWIAAATIQFFFNGILLVGYASSLGMMILYFKLENPDAALDRETGVFNSHVFYMYLKQMFDRGKSVSILMISIDQRFLDKSAVDEERVLDIIDYLRQFEGVKVFKGVNCDFVLMFEKKEFYEDSKNQIIQRFHDDWNGMTYEPLFLGIANSQIAESSDEIYHLIRYFKQHYNMLNVHKLIEIDRGMVEERRKYAAMVKTIGDALREDRVEVFYQPIYNVKKNRFVSAEALVRIRNLDGTLIQPGEFIPVAESTGIISQLGERVFEKVCQFITEQKIWEIGIEYIEINLSVHQCESHSLARRYLAIMNKYGVDPTMINFEITESGTIQTKALFMNNMKSLMDSGATFTLDDFGNGESNLNYIVDMPVEIVKFDRYMTKAYFEKSRGKVVMETTTDMILKLGLKIVSEGVETAEQLETVKSLGVQYIQGYYFSRPLPQEAFLGFIREWAG